MILKHCDNDNCDATFEMNPTAENAWSDSRPREWVLLFAEGERHAIRPYEACSWACASDIAHRRARSQEKK